MRSLVSWLGPWALALGLGFWEYPAFGLPNEVSYEIAAQLNTTSQSIEGVEQVTITNRTGVELSELYFHLPPNAFQRGSDTAYQRDLQAFFYVWLNEIYAGA